MSDTQSATAHHGPTVVTYLGIFAALAILTTVSFVVYGASKTEIPSISPDTAFWIIMAVAVVKTFCVASIFMHLKYDWGNVYFMLVPAIVLGLLVLLVLMPDIVLVWRH